MCSKSRLPNVLPSGFFSPTQWNSAEEEYVSKHFFYDFWDWSQNDEGETTQFCNKRQNCDVKGRIVGFNSEIWIKADSIGWFLHISVRKGDQRIPQRRIVPLWVCLGSQTGLALWSALAGAELFAVSWSDYRSSSLKWKWEAKIKTINKRFFI